MTGFQAAILGIVEGLTEFLPVSSTGHLILASELLGLARTDFQKTFEIAIQLGAIAAVVVTEWRSFLRVALLKRVAAAFVPTALIGFALYKVIKGYLLDSPVLVASMLIAGAVAMLLVERRVSTRPAPQDEDLAAMPYARAAALGLVQSLAVVPGVSRSGATILGGLAFGMRREAIVRFSFLLAVPTMLAATAYDLLKSAGDFAGADFGALGIGLAASFVVALAAIRFFLRFVRTRTFVPFAVYRILAGLAFLLFLR